MIIFMENNPGRNTVKGFCLDVKIFIKKSEGNFLFPDNILPDLWDAQASFIIRPFISVYSFYPGIDEDTFVARIARIIILFIIFKVFNDLDAINYEEPYVVVNLWGS